MTSTMLCSLYSDIFASPQSLEGVLLVYFEPEDGCGAGTQFPGKLTIMALMWAQTQVFQQPPVHVRFESLWVLGCF